MNNYITLDGKKYATSAKTWRAVVQKPATERRTLLGSLDVTYGTGTPTAWEGEVIGPITARDTGWGTLANLLTTLAKKETVTFTDHDGNTGNVHCLGDFERRSLMNKWDDTGNVFYVLVRLVIS